MPTMVRNLSKHDLTGSGKGLLPIPVFGTFAITTPQSMKNIVSEVHTGENVYLVDYDQTLNACNKNDEFAAKLDWESSHDRAGLQNVIFLHEHDQAHILNFDVKKKIVKFRETKKNPKVFIWTARSLEMLADIQILLKQFKIAELFDGIICCDGQKEHAIKYITTKTSPDNIYVIDNSRRNCEKAKKIIPPENVEFYIGENLQKLRTKNDLLRRMNKSLEKEVFYIRLGFTFTCMILGGIALRKFVLSGN